MSCLGGAVEAVEDPFEDTAVVSQAAVDRKTGTESYTLVETRL